MRIQDTLSVFRLSLFNHARNLFRSIYVPEIINSVSCQSFFKRRILTICTRFGLEQAGRPSSALSFLPGSAKMESIPRYLHIHWTAAKERAFFYAFFHDLFFCEIRPRWNVIKLLICTDHRTDTRILGQTLSTFSLVAFCQFGSPTCFQ